MSKKDPKSPVRNLLWPLFAKRDLEEDAKKLGISQADLHEMIDGKQTIPTALAIEMAGLVELAPIKILNAQSEQELINLGVEPQKPATVAPSSPSHGCARDMTPERVGSSIRTF